MVHMKEARTCTYTFRLTDREKRSMVAGAKRSRKPTQAFVREAVLDAARAFLSPGTRVKRAGAPASLQAGQDAKAPEAGCGPTSGVS